MRPHAPFALLLFLTIGGALPATALEPSFDCPRAATAVEKLICADGGLAALDRALGEAFAKRRKELPPAEAEKLVRQQRGWLKARDRTCPLTVLPDSGELPPATRWRAMPCLAEVYRDRLATLGAPQEVRQPAAAAEPGYVHPLCIAAARPYFDDGVPPPVPVTACNAGNADNPPSEEPAGLVVRSPRTAAYPYYAYQRVGWLPDGREVGLVRANAGNTLDVSDVVALRRQASADGEVMLSVDTLVPGGDRCVGGLLSARLTGEALLVVESATPAGLMAAAGATAGTASAWEESLPDCASCCAATVTRSRPLSAPGAPAGTVVLAEVGLDYDAWLDDAVLRHRCLARAVRATVSGLPHDFEASALAMLGKAFDACIATGER